MLFNRHQYPRLIDGTISRTYRAWKRPRVKVGSQYRIHKQGVLEVDALSQVQAADITDHDARLAGFEDSEALIAKLTKSAAVTPRTKLYRVDFHYVALPNPRDALAADGELSTDQAAELSKRLAEMDRLSKHGPWTEETLAVIESHPRVVASKIATQLGRDRDAFKADVRKLKKLGLTVSHEVGYEISPRGRAYLDYTREKDAGHSTQAPARLDD